MNRRSTGQLCKTIALGIGALVLLAVFVLMFVAGQVDRNWQRKLAAIRASGDPASIAELAPKTIPDDENAAAYLEQIKPQLKAFEKNYAAFSDSPNGIAYYEARKRGEQPTADQLAAIRQIIDKYPAIDQMLVEAAACDEYASLLDFSLDHTQFLDALLKHVSINRSQARFLKWRMQVLMADGKPDEAVDRGIQLLQLARLHDSEPTLVSYLVGIAVRGIAAESLYDVLGAGPVSPELHAALHEELAQHDDPQRLARVLATERAVSISGLASLPPGANWFQRSVFALFGWPVKSQWIGMLDIYDVQIGLAGRPWHEVNQQIGRAGAPQQATGFGVMADLLVPAIQATYDAHARNLAVLRALRIFNALKQFRDEHGRQASGLEVLSLPKEATIDPFSGEPLKLKYTADGWIIYSVMQNGVDDGGSFIDVQDYGVAPRRWRVTE